ncbi:hypothetical protein [Phenylobacterium sp.]|uniref:hypothetical protein n=1 Tax=Phenylobacterium sp. TaxID=1871053 RepID=UPI00286CB77C|nr:hypothetical protein [Phenylobacterium sp.]
MNRKKIHDAAKALGAKVDNDFEKSILDAAIDGNDPNHDPAQSDAMNIANEAVRDATQTLASTKATCEVVKKSEKDK